MQKKESLEGTDTNQAFENNNGFAGALLSFLSVEAYVRLISPAGVFVFGHDRKVDKRDQVSSA